MADEKESAPRARPFTPPLPPFRGPATASRPPVSALTPPESKRGSLFVGTRVAAKPAVLPAPEVASIDTLAPAADHTATPAFLAAVEAHREAATREPEASPEPTGAASVAVDSPRAEAIAATEAMPWLFADPGAAQPVGSDEPEPTVASAESRSASELMVAQPVATVDAAAVLESIAARIRAGEIAVGPADPPTSEAAVVATVLVALLGQQGR